MFNMGIARAFQAFGRWKEDHPEGTYDQWANGLSTDAVRAIEAEIASGEGPNDKEILRGLEWYARGREGYTVSFEDKETGVRWECRRVPEDPEREFNFHNYMRSMGTLRPPIKEERQVKIHSGEGEPRCG